VASVKLWERTNPMPAKQQSITNQASDLWERLTVGGVVVILVAFVVLAVANLATTLCSAQLPR